MNFMEFREGRWVIGSDAVESGAQQCKDGFTGPVMRWTRRQTLEYYASLSMRPVNLVDWCGALRTTEPGGRTRER